MGNKQCAAISPVYDTAVIRYAVPAVFTKQSVLVNNVAIQDGGKGKHSENDKSPKSTSFSHPKKDKLIEKDPQLDPDGEEEELISDEETDNIIIEDDEMNELFEEDLDADDAAIDREAVDSALDDKNNDKDNDSSQSGGDITSAVSSSSPYGHGKRLAESSSALLPLFNDTNSV